MAKKRRKNYTAPVMDEDESSTNSDVIPVHKIKKSMLKRHFHSNCMLTITTSSAYKAIETYRKHLCSFYTELLDVDEEACNKSIYDVTSTLKFIFLHDTFKKLYTINVRLILTINAQFDDVIKTTFEIKYKLKYESEAKLMAYKLGDYLHKLHGKLTLTISSPDHQSLIISVVWEDEIPLYAEDKEIE